MARKARKFISKEINQMIINLHQSNNYTITEISKMVNISRNSISNVINLYEKNKEFVTANEKYKKTCVIKSREHCQINEFIFHSVAINNAITQGEIVKMVQDNNNTTVSRSTVSRKLKKMKITRKRLSLIPIERNTAERIEERAVYASFISRFSFDNLVFLDESGFNKHTNRKYGYSMENTKAFITVQANRGRNVSLMCAIGLEGVVASEVLTGPYNENEFARFIQIYLIPYFENNPNKVLIMDNARFHKTESILRLLRENNIAFKFLPAYSPQLNPIEEFFSMLKSKFCGLKIEIPGLEVDEYLHTLLAEGIKYKTECEGFFSHLNFWLEKARTKQFFE